MDSFSQQVVLNLESTDGLIGTIQCKSMSLFQFSLEETKIIVKIQNVEFYYNQSTELLFTA